MFLSFKFSFLSMFGCIVKFITDEFYRLIKKDCKARQDFVKIRSGGTLYSGALFWRRSSNVICHLRCHVPLRRTRTHLSERVDGNITKNQRKYSAIPGRINIEVLWIVQKDKELLRYGDRNGSLISFSMLINRTA